MEPTIRSTSLDPNTFVLGLNLGGNVQLDQPLPTRFHFVLDNSGSMGRMTSMARDCFAKLIDNCASAPSSLVVFANDATEIGRNFESAQSMCNAKIPSQGMTNITAGLSRSLDIILDIEMKHGEGNTHHVLVLLSDGAHNVGPLPEVASAGLGQKLKLASPNLQLSVIVVGVSKNSNTNMGMIMKTNLETLPMPSLLPIYFAHSPNEMTEALVDMTRGLEGTVNGCSVQVQPIFRREIEPKGLLSTIANKISDGKKWFNQEVEEGILHNVGESVKTSVNIWFSGQEESTLICVGKCAPSALAMTLKDGTTIEVPIVMNTSKKHTVIKSAVPVDTSMPWTCAQCTFINGHHQSMCEMCEATKPTPMFQSCEEEEHKTSNLSASAMGAVMAGQALDMDGREVAPQVFDEDLATKALQVMLQRARVSKVAAGAKSTCNALHVLKKLISSFEEQMEKKTAALAEQRASSTDSGFNFSKLNGFDRVRQHKQTARALTGLRELRNQLAAIEAFESKDSSSQADFLNGSQSKFAAKALSRSAKRNAEVSEGIDPMIALVEECNGMEMKMKLALRADMCKRIALATREACSEDIKKIIGKHPTLSSESNEKDVFVKVIGNVQNRTQFRDIFLESGQPCTVEHKVQAKKLIADVIEKGMTLKSIEQVLETNKPNSLLYQELVHIIDGSSMIDDCLDEYLARKSGNNGCGNKERSSYLSLLTQREQLGEWAESAGECGQICTGGAYEALMFLGTLAYPIDVERRAATQLDPYAMKITRVRTSLIDTASLCCALKSNHELVPPEGGVALADALVLVDCDCPSASKLCVRSKLVGEIYTSVVLARDLNMYTGCAQRVALHAHAFASLAKPKNKVKAYVEKKKDLEAMLKRNFLGNAYQCADCSFGPIDHTACGDLESHHGERVGNARINNACPKCGWFSHSIEDWPAWNGEVPEEMFNDKLGTNPSESRKTKENKLSEQEEEVENAGLVPSSSAVEVMLRILYSARSVMGYNTCKELVSKLANWEESITIADGVDHPYQMALAVACLCDEDEMENVFTTPALLLLLNETCSRSARDVLKMKFSAANKAANIGNTDDTGGGEENLMLLSRKIVNKMLGITADSAPQAKGLEESEPRMEAVRESCCGDFNLKTGKDDTKEYDEYGYEVEKEEEDEGFDFEGFVNTSLEPVLAMLLFSLALRQQLKKRGGGWTRLEQDMETGLVCYKDVIDGISDKTSSLLRFGPSALFDAVLKVEVGTIDHLEAYMKEEGRDSRGKMRMLATMAAQGFLHYNSSKRRTMERGGCLKEPLGDIRDGQTLRNLAIDLRMYIYQARVGEKMKEWKCVGSDIVIAKARAADLGQYMEMLTVHAHGLDKPTFWGLWKAARSDGAKGEKVAYFLSKANAPFSLAHKPFH